MRESKVLFHLLLFVYPPSTFNPSQRQDTHTPIGPTCGRIWHLVMTCCLCRIEMSETQANCFIFMNEYSMHNAMQNSRTRKEKTDNKSSIDEIAFLAFHINKAESFI